jgi:hypothetical protein
MNDLGAARVTRDGVTTNGRRKDGAVPLYNNIMQSNRRNKLTVSSKTIIPGGCVLDGGANAFPCSTQNTPVFVVLA